MTLTQTRKAKKRFWARAPSFSCSIFFGKSDTFTNYFIGMQQLWTEIESYFYSKKIFTHKVFIQLLLPWGFSIIQKFKTRRITKVYSTVFSSIFCFKKRTAWNRLQWWWNYTFRMSMGNSVCTLMCQVYMKYWISPAARVPCCWSKILYYRRCKKIWSIYLTRQKASRRHATPRDGQTRLVLM